MTNFVLGTSFFTSGFFIIPSAYGFLARFEAVRKELFKFWSFVFGSTFHGRIFTFEGFKGPYKKKTKGDEDLQRMECSVVKSGKHNTRTLSLVQNRLILKKKKTCKQVH
jgi:hypothetical protein